MTKTSAASSPVLTAEQTNLRHIDLRLRGLTMNSPDSPEIARMQAARKDVLTRISAEDLRAYDRMIRTPKTDAQLKAEAEAERLAMDANRDKPSI